MFTCIVCRGTDSRDRLVDEVFKVDGRYVQVKGSPSTVCVHCGEKSFSSETTEKVRQLVRGQAPSTKSVTMRVYEFA